MDQFLSKHAAAVIGTLSGFDRLVFRGTLRQLAYRAGMMSYLWTVQVLLKDFARHAETLTRRLKEASEALADRTGRPIRYLSSSSTSCPEPTLTRRPPVERPGLRTSTRVRSGQ